MYTSVARSCCFHLLLYGTGWGEDVFVCLCVEWAIQTKMNEWIANPNKNLASEQALPRFFRIVLVVRIYQQWPLIPGDSHFATGKLWAYSNQCQQVKNTVIIMMANSASFQSRLAGQRSDPVTGWWKPRVVLTFRLRGGTKGESWGVIQSTTTPFKLLVSSDLALDIPFWIFCKWDECHSLLIIEEIYIPSRPLSYTLLQRLL